jgi:hypothetical protein
VCAADQLVAQGKVALALGHMADQGFFCRAPRRVSRRPRSCKIRPATLRLVCYN